MSHRTLLLNSYHEPHSIVSWQDAICFLYLDKAEVVESYTDTVSSPSVTYQIPAVIRLKTSIPSVRRGVFFNRANILARDNHTCQYCGAKVGSGLTYDHVVPKCQGGKTNWLNIVACCKPCNSEKGGRSPEQAGLSLLRQPFKPAFLPRRPLYIEGEELPELWVPYLQVSC